MHIQLLGPNVFQGSARSQLRWGGNFCMQLGARTFSIERAKNNEYRFNFLQITFRRLNSRQCFRTRGRNVWRQRTSARAAQLALSTIQQCPYTEIVKISFKIPVSASWSGSTPNHLLPAIHLILCYITSKIVHNFLSYPADKHTKAASLADEQRFRYDTRLCELCCLKCNLLLRRYRTKRN